MIGALYPPIQPALAITGREDVRAWPCVRTLTHHGRPCAIQSIDVSRLVELARSADAVIEMAASVGDTVVESMPSLRVFGPGEQIGERELRKGIELSGERTFEQDPKKYAIRLQVDMAIRALSPAVNDPTTAVQALDQIEDLLLRLGQRRLEIGDFRDRDGKLRLVVSFPAWDDLLRLAFDEICFYGATSVQVMRRMNALICDLMPTVPGERRPALAHWEGRLKATIARSFASDEENIEASKEDRQGLGVPRQSHTGMYRNEVDPKQNEAPGRRRSQEDARNQE